MNIRLQHFCFRGGDKSEYDLFDFAGKNDSAWQKIAGIMANSAFPTEPEDERSIPHTVFANLPGEQFGEDVRIHCVYFLIERARDFPNAFCFAYRQSECSLELLAGVTAEDWYDRCVKLTESHTEVELPQRTPPSDVPKFFHYNPQPNYYYLYGFPDSKGKLYSGRFTAEQWEDIMEGNAPGYPPQSSQSPPLPPKEDSQKNPRDPDPPPSPPHPFPEPDLGPTDRCFRYLMRQFVCSELSPILGTLRIVVPTLIVAVIGCRISYEHGYSVGRPRWYFVGYEKGRSDGYVDGHSKGYAEGVSAREKTRGRVPNPEKNQGPEQPQPPQSSDSPHRTGDTPGAAPSQSEPPSGTQRPMKKVQRINRAEKGESTDSSSEVSAHAAHPNKASGNTKSTKPRKAVPQQQR